MVTTTTPAQQKVILRNVSWETYQRLLRDHQDASGTHFIYNGEELEIMVLSAEREQPKRALEILVDVLTVEFELDVVQAGSITYQREDLHQGFEPDSGYYFAHAPELRGRCIDPKTDPPPDLIIEVDVISPSLPR